ncbi:hypothetical protein R3Q06_23845 [Rhodococcus erythropolis]|uniref:hypothetical protein n=1 Tax=Rhodococcus erythropolis TaxID=1833 RepID=UPI002949F3C5|nr:hypothetical protein [Rhodococcus erythropolis]MDV6276537.1 hypothetical protein [Rhodococcus erythropolis]
MIWMLRSKAGRCALRGDIAAAADTLREQLIVVRTITESGELHGPRLDAARMRAKPTRDYLLAAAIRLPKVERELTYHWEHAAAMTFWYSSGDRGFAPAEKQAAALLATLPDGVDSGAAQESIDAFSNRTEQSVLSSALRGRTTALFAAPVVIDQNGLRDRIVDDHTRLKYQDVAVPDTASMLRAHREYFPWMAHALRRLSEPRTQAELEDIAQQWCSERGKYIGNTPDIVIDTPGAVTGSGTH